MSRAPEYTKKYPCPHCDTIKYGVEHGLMAMTLYTSMLLLTGLLIRRLGVK